MTPEIPMCWCGGNKNFGDWIGPYIVERATGRAVVRVDSAPGVLIAAGSILNWATAGAIVWGAGLANRSDRVDPKADIRAVRGPISREIAKHSGARCPEVYGDPALLLPRFIKKPEASHDVGLVPHYTEYEVMAHLLKDRPIRVIDVLRSVPEVVRDIASCKSILSSSLHGLIVADAYGIPSRWVKLSNAVLGDGTKFHDHFRATGREVYEPHVIRWASPIVELSSATQAADPYKIAKLQEGLWAARPF